MEFVGIIIVTTFLSIILKIVFEYKIKELKKIATRQDLDEISKKYPNNVTIAKEYLKKLNNETVKVEEEKDSETSLYIAATNKIIIGNIDKSFTRIQTIAHECLHSVQDKKILKFNFIFSNLYLLFFVCICILAIFNKLPCKMFFLSLFILSSLVYFMVRAYLENDAMIKARYLAKEYMEESKITKKDEVDKMVEGFDQINGKGIKCMNFQLFLTITIKITLFSIICLI